MEFVWSKRFKEVFIYLFLPLRVVLLLKSGDDLIQIWTSKTYSTFQCPKIFLISFQGSRGTCNSLKIMIFTFHKCLLFSGACAIIFIVDSREATGNEVSGLELNWGR